MVFDFTIDSEEYFIIPIGGISDFINSKFFSLSKTIILSWPAFTKIASPVSILNFPNTAVINIPLNFASTSSLFTVKTTFSNGYDKLEIVLNIEAALAMYIPAVIPFPDTSANMKKYSFSPTLTTSKKSPETSLAGTFFA